MESRISNIPASSPSLESIRDLLKAQISSVAELRPDAAASGSITKQETATTPEIPLKEANHLSAARSSVNLMAGNFYNSGYERSEYVQSRLDGFKVEQSFGNKLASLVNVLSLSFNSTLAELRERRQGSAMSSSTIDPKYLAAYHEQHRTGIETGH